jgi:hypothetical protein
MRIYAQIGKWQYGFPMLEKILPFFMNPQRDSVNQ